MQIEVKEINKISLNENELLFIKMPRSSTMARENATKVLLENLPKDWKGRVFIIKDDVELTKVTKEK